MSFNTGFFIQQATTPVTQYSMLFDGVNEYISIPHNTNTSFANTDAFTISAWVRSSNYALATTGNSIISKRNGSGNPGYNMYFYGGVLYIHISNNGSNRIIIGTSGVSFTNNTWYHVAFTKTTASNAAGIIVYVNGVAVATTVVENTLTLSCATSIDILVGAAFGTGEFWLGYLGMISIWGRTLTPTEILDDYNGGKMTNDPNTTNLVFRFLGGINSLFAAFWTFVNGVAPIDTNCGISINMEYVDKTTTVPV